MQLSFPKSINDSISITHDESSFSMEGMVAPRFYNMGEGVVRIEGIPLKKHEYHLGASEGTVATGRVKIEFADQEADNLVVCFFDKLVPEAPDNGDCR